MFPISIGVPLEQLGLRGLRDWVASPFTITGVLLKSALYRWLHVAVDPQVLHSCLYVAPVHITGFEIPVTRTWIVSASAVQHPEVLEYDAVALFQTEPILVRRVVQVTGKQVVGAVEAVHFIEGKLPGNVLRACLRSLQYVKLRLLPEGVIMSHSYSSDISREQFARILPCLESARRRTKPRTVDLYDVFCGVLYLLKSGCQWRMLPADFPDWRTCYKYFRQWSERPDPAKYSILEQVLKKIG